MTSNYRGAAPARPVLLVTTEELLSLATGYRCPLPPLADRLAALESHAKEYAASRRRRRPADPKQRTLFAGGEP